MDFLDSILLGIVEGLTEFLPISSTYHLIFASELLRIGEGDFIKLFNVFIQSGAILAVLVLYGKTLSRDFVLVKKTLVAFLPTAVLGALSYRIIKQIFFESHAGMTAIFILVGLFFLLFEDLVRRGRIKPQKPLSELTYRNAILIGLVQCLAFLPGVSRAGAVILIMMALGYRRDHAAAFSFLLAIPTILAAGGYDLLRSKDVLAASTGSLGLLASGLVVSFIVAFLIMKWFIRYLQHHTLSLFGVYRLLAGAAALIFLWLR